jgi:SAM-dependent methyltransferase
MIDDFVHWLKAKTIQNLITNEGRTLDNGCGDLKYTIYLPQPIGIETNTHFEEHRNLPDLFMSSCNLSFPDGYFKTSCFFDVLEHIPNIEQAIRESHRVLDKDGELLITDPSDRVLFITRLLCGRIKHAFRGNPGHIHHFNKKKLVEVLEPHFHLEKVIPRVIFTGYRFRRNA